MFNLMRFSFFNRKTKAGADEEVEGANYNSIMIKQVSNYSFISLIQSVLSTTDMEEVGVF